MENIDLFGNNIVKMVSSIDKIKISLFDHTMSLREDLLSLSTPVPNPKKINRKKYPDSRYSCHYPLIIGGFSVTMLSDNLGANLFLVILQPTTGLQHHISQVLSKHKPLLTINCVEVAIDSYTETKDETIILRDELNQHLVQTYQHEESMCYPSDTAVDRTVYASKRKKGSRPSKYVKVYCRFDEGKKHDKGILPLPSVRMEITLNRAIQKKLNFPFPIPQEEIRNLAISRYAKLCTYDFDAFEKFYLSPKRENDHRKIAIETMRGLCIKGHCRFNRVRPVAEILEIHKLVPGINRHKYIIPLVQENLLFQKAVSEMEGYDVPLILPVPFTDSRRFKKLIKRRKNADILNKETAVMENDDSLDLLPY